jgi:hypothetical protein
MVHCLDHVIFLNPRLTYSAYFIDVAHSIILPVLFVIVCPSCCFAIGIVHPWFSELMFANTIMSDETRSFAREIERDPDPPDSLYSVEFDEVVKIVQRIGKADELLDSEV